MNKTVTVTADMSAFVADYEIYAPSARQVLPPPALTYLPLDFPPLVELATKAVHEFETVTASPPDRWTCAMLLRDLTRPASRDAWLRWLGSALGWPESEHCPNWDWCEAERTVLDEPAVWTSFRYDGRVVVFYREGDEIPPDWTGVPISNLDVSGPDAWPVALRQVILMCGGAS